MFCNPRSRTRLRRLRKYSDLMSSAIMRSAGADDRGESYDVVAATRADVSDGYTGFDAAQARRARRDCRRIRANVRARHAAQCPCDVSLQP